MAIPTSPSVIVRENDISIFTPNVNSSVVGIVGFSTKGPVDKATLVTSQDNLISLFGKPDITLGCESQALEGALEILEATNQLYFVRAASAADNASASVTVGASPAVKLELSSYTLQTLPSSISYEIVSNDGLTNATGLVTVASAEGLTTKSAVFLNAFNADSTNNQDVFALEDSGEVFLGGRFAGSGASLRVSSTGINFTRLNVSGDLSGAPAADQTVKGYTASSIELCAKSKYPGTGYNLSAQRDGTTAGVSVEIDNISVKDSITVNNDGAEAESFRQTDLIPSGATFAEFIFNVDEDANQSEYIYFELRETDGTDYTAKNDFVSKATAAGFAGDVDDSPVGTPRFLKLIEGTYGLENGTNGDTNVNALLGNAASKTGMHQLDDDGLNISIALTPGVTDDAIQNALISIAETSQNFLALVAPPYAIGSVQNAIEWMNGQDSENRTAALNTSYAAVYWPWVQVFNRFAGAEEWYDPAIFAARQCVFTDATSDPWFAPAGFRRGRLLKPTDVEIPLNQGDRDALYANSINPIFKDRTSGITIFGQRTAQRLPTALDRVNVRRLMIFIRKALLDIGRPFQFEPNDEFTWEQVEGAINPFLGDLKARRAIIEGVVKCDSSTNTPGRVDRNELWCAITIKPTKAAETVIFEVNLTNQSANFS